MRVVICYELASEARDGDITALWIMLGYNAHPLQLHGDKHVSCDFVVYLDEAGDEGFKFLDGEKGRERAAGRYQVSRGRLLRPRNDRLWPNSAVQCQQLSPPSGVHGPSARPQLGHVF
jgi:hypothetical protein